MNRFAAVCLLALIPSGAWSQTVSDAALAECQADGAAFTSVKDCLPPTNVSLQMLAAVASPEFYGKDGAVIVDGCSAVNKRSPERWSCTKMAIRDAVELLQMVGSADKIEDQRFRGVSDPAKFELLRQKEDAVKEPFGSRPWSFGIEIYGFK